MKRAFAVDRTSLIENRAFPASALIYSLDTSAKECAKDKKAVRISESERSSSVLHTMERFNEKSFSSASSAGFQVYKRSSMDAGGRSVGRGS